MVCVILIGVASNILSQHSLDLISLLLSDTMNLRMGQSVEQDVTT